MFFGRFCVDSALRSLTIEEDVEVCFGLVDVDFCLVREPVIMLDRRAFSCAFDLGVSEDGEAHVVPWWLLVTVFCARSKVKVSPTRLCKQSMGRCAGKVNSQVKIQRRIAHVISLQKSQLSALRALACLHPESLRDPQRPVSFLPRYSKTRRTKPIQKNPGRRHGPLIFRCCFCCKVWVGEG